MSEKNPNINDLAWCLVSIYDECWGSVDYAIPPIEDAEFEIIQPKQLPSSDAT